MSSVIKNFTRAPAAPATLIICNLSSALQVPLYPSNALMTSTTASDRTVTTMEVPSGADLTADAIRDFHAVFTLFDRRNENSIQLAELSDVLALLGERRHSDAELRDMVADCHDADPDEEDLEPIEALDFKQFLRFIAVFMRDKHTAVRSSDVFHALDCDDSGNISASELHRVLTRFGMSLNMDEAIAMATLADEGHDGEINIHEFKNIIRLVNKEGKGTLPNASKASFSTPMTEASFDLEDKTSAPQVRGANLPK